MTVRVRQAARFDRSSPVLWYWLGRCEGFTVAGATRGVVEEVVSDGDPNLPDAIVVRTRSRRSRTIRVPSVAWVVPAERLLIVERLNERAPARRPRRQPEVRRRAEAIGGASVVLGRLSAAAARRAALATGVLFLAFADDAVRAVAPVAQRLLRRFGLELLRLSSLLAAAASNGTRLVRSARWRRSGRSERSASTRRSPVRSRSSSRRRTTSSRRSNAPNSSSAAGTTSST